MKTKQGRKAYHVHTVTGSCYPKTRENKTEARKKKSGLMAGQTNHAHVVCLEETEPERNKKGYIP
jgi:hypothetical protein